MPEVRARVLGAEGGEAFMMEKRYSITEKQLGELKNLVERFDVALPMRYAGGCSVGDFDEAIDLIDEMEQSIENDWNRLSDVLRDFRFFIEDIEGQEAE